MSGGTRYFCIRKAFKNMFDMDRVVLLRMNPIEELYRESSAGYFGCRTFAQKLRTKTKSTLSLTAHNKA
jgi:hypothetical protein